MKKITIAIACFIAFGNISFILPPDLSAQQKDFSCSVTRTAQESESGVDCWGNPVSATASATCTRSAETCQEAGFDAYMCARLYAALEVTAYIYDVASCDD
jgi:hypothetical protein